jgi:hypothetical protein
MVAGLLRVWHDVIVEGVEIEIQNGKFLKVHRN